MDYREINNLLEKYIRERNNPKTTGKECREAPIDEHIEARPEIDRMEEQNNYRTFYVIA